MHAISNRIEIVNLRLSIFSNYGTVPLHIANQYGYFKEHGLSVEITPTTSSIEQMVGVIDGQYHIAATAIDNIIAYNCGQGAAPTTKVPDLKVFLGSASYRLPFVVAPQIKTFNDLNGCTIAVDALDTGFAFLLREMLEINGCAADSYEFKSFGAPKERWQAIKTGEAVGALLNAHLEKIAHQANYNTLTSNPDPWDNYEGNTFCASSRFLAEGPVDAFISAMRRAVAFTKHPDNTDAVATALSQHIGSLEPKAAIEVAKSLQGEHSILVDDLPVSRSGISEVLRLREKYSGTHLGLTPEDLCDHRVSFVP